MTQFTPGMIGKVVEVTLIQSQHTGDNYYSSQIDDVSANVYAGRLAEYGSQYFVFEPVGKESPTRIEWAKPANTWPNKRYRVEIIQEPKEESHDLPSPDA